MYILWRASLRILVLSLTFICGRRENKLPTNDFSLNFASPKVYVEIGLTWFPRTKILPDRINSSLSEWQSVISRAGNNRFESIRWANRFESIRYGESKTNGVRLGRGYVVRSIQTCTAPGRVHGCLATPVGLCSHRSINLASCKL